MSAHGSLAASAVSCVSRASVSVCMMIQWLLDSASSEALNTYNPRKVAKPMAMETSTSRLPEIPARLRKLAAIPDADFGVCVVMLN